MRQEIKLFPGPSRLYIYLTLNIFGQVIICNHAIIYNSENKIQQNWVVHVEVHIEYTV